MLLLLLLLLLLLSQWWLGQGEFLLSRLVVYA
jgi:hypothetical protein